MTWEELWQEEQFLVYFLRFFSASEKVTLAQVCFYSDVSLLMNDNFINLNLYIHNPQESPE